MQKTQEQFSVSHRDVVNAENAGAVFGKPQGCGECRKRMPTGRSVLEHCRSKCRGAVFSKSQGCDEYPSRGYLVPETHADKDIGTRTAQEQLSRSSFQQFRREDLVPPKGFDFVDSF